MKNAVDIYTSLQMHCTEQIQQIVFSDHKGKVNEIAHILGMSIVAVFNILHEIIFKIFFGPPYST